MMEYLGKISGERGRNTTVAWMVRLIKEGTKDPLIIKTARQIVRKYGDRTRFNRARAIHNWIQANIKYVNDPRGLEMLRPARKILESGIGDCDEHVVLSGAMYRAVGLPFKIITLSTKPGKPHHHTIGLVKTEYGWLLSDTTLPLHTFGDDWAYWRSMVSYAIYNVD